MQINRRDPVAYHARVAPQQAALVDIATQRTFTYEALHDRVGRLASAMRHAYSVQSGDRVVVLSRNSSDVFELQYACWRLGAIFVPVNWRLTAAELGFIVNDANPRLLVVDVAFAEAGETLSKENAGLAVLWRGEPSSAYEEVIATHSPLTEVVEQALDGIASLIYTSGTTGRPKGAQITHLMELFNCVNYVVATGLTRASRTLAVLPLFHVGGLHCYPNPTFYVGGCVAVMQSFEPAPFLEWLTSAEHRVTHVFAVPTIYLRVSQEPGFATADFSHLVSASVGGSSITTALLNTLEDSGLPIQQGWGMTESTSLGTQLPRNLARAKLGSAGLPAINVSIRVVDDQNNELPAGEVGELQVKGPTVMKAYWNRPEANLKSHCGDWFRTGDAAYLDPEGFLYIVDRWTDMYISGGENVYPAEVESVLCEMASVLQAAVIGIPNPSWGQVGRAFIVARPGHSITQSDVLKHCTDRLAKYKLPAEVVFVDSLPMNAAGKILKSQLPRETTQDAG